MILDENKLNLIDLSHPRTLYLILKSIVLIVGIIG